MTELTRISGPDHNADLSALVTIHAHEQPWRSAAVPGADEKLFERIGRGPGARETALLRLAPGFSAPRERAECRIDILVLEGAIDLLGRQCAAGHYLRIPPKAEIGLRTTAGATIMLKKRAGPADGEAIALDTNDRANWAPWGGRGSEKAQIYDPGSLPEASWVGFMLPHLTIPEHDHAGGEEIFILEGELRDERGSYGPRTWVRFPIGVTHTPSALAQGCLMFVREGDVAPC